MEVNKGKALRQDMALYDGIAPTRQRKSSSGGYVQGLAIGDEIDVLMVHGQGLNRTQTTIQNCINSLGSNSVSLKFAPGTWTIESDTTIPANLTSIIPAGCVFSISTGITLTFSGPLLTDSDNFKTGAGTLTATDDKLLQSVAGTNNIAASTLSTLTVLKDGQEFFIIPAVTNTTTVTINVNSTGAVNARKNQSGGAVALVANDLIADNLYRLVYNSAGPHYVVSNVSSYAQGADIASATTINLDTATGDYVHVTGTTTITGVTLKQGQERTLVFDDALTFTNGASLLLPGAANITTAAGDTAVLRGEASGVVRCISYTLKTAGPAENPVHGTAVTASGTAVAFTSIPSWVRKITVMFSGLSLSGSDNILIQLGDSGGLETTGYLSTCAAAASGATTIVTSTAGFIMRAVGAETIGGVYDLLLVDSATNTWSGHGGFNRSSGTIASVSGGDKALSGTLDRLSIVPTGTDTFDAGTINIRYEY